ncbi:unnamed protein product [Prorocentrum cordatum]|uniref:Uncharacterized protein n=1 Tax=Prorocentrum cordatum TaxID=2364126 RepID=A0ABN9QHT3_9DINO|nr:unnamed protein product [Polarella glacialis]
MAKAVLDLVAFMLVDQVAEQGTAVVTGKVRTSHRTVAEDAAVKHGRRNREAPGGQQEISELRRAMAARGGVVRAKDGFEVFYGVEQETKPCASGSVEGDGRDGYDMFYGKQAQRPPGQRKPRRSAPEAACSSPARGAPTDEGGATPRGPLASAPSQQPLSARTSRPAASTRCNVIPSIPEVATLPAGVETFSLCEEPAVPEGVEVFTMSRNATVPRTPRETRTPRECPTPRGCIAGAPRECATPRECPAEPRTSPC